MSKSTRRLAVLAVLVAVGWAVGACHSPEPVIPFMDAGDPCESANHLLDCAELGDTKCGTTSTTCPRLIYGCEDGGYFSEEDDSQCPPEAGYDAPSLGDVSLLGDGAVID